jgi:hypothetical protein
MSFVICLKEEVKPSKQCKPGRHLYVQLGKDTGTSLILILFPSYPPDSHFLCTHIDGTSLVAKGIIGHHHRAIKGGDKGGDITLAWCGCGWCCPPLPTNLVHKSYWQPWPLTSWFDGPYIMMRITQWKTKWNRLTSLIECFYHDSFLYCTHLNAP